MNIGGGKTVVVVKKTNTLKVAKKMRKVLPVMSLAKQLDKVVEGSYSPGKSSQSLDSDK